MESTAACLFPRSGVTAPIADPFVGLKRRNVRDRDAYTLLSELDQFFACFIFEIDCEFLDRDEIVNKTKVIDLVCRFVATNSLKQKFFSQLFFFLNAFDRCQ
jgi:hypothetical protein